MTEEIAEVIGAIAAAFVGTILLDMWLGGGLLAGLSPANFPAFGGSALPANAGTNPATPAGAATSTQTGGSGPTTGGIASANI
jgi:hypothetical protein